MRPLLKDNPFTVGRVTPCGPQTGMRVPTGARGATRPTIARLKAGLRRSQQGVALVITLILLAVITFMAITFLAIARRERGSVTTETDQHSARLASEGGMDQAIAQLVATIIANSNAYAPDLRSEERRVG